MEEGREIGRVREKGRGEWERKEEGGRVREVGRRKRRGVSHSLCCLLAHDDGAQLAVVSDEDHLLGTQHYGDHAFRFRCLGNRERVP